MFTPGLAKGLEDLDYLKCTHDHSLQAKAGGTKADGVWNSAAAAAYPAELNLIIAHAIASLVSSDRPPSMLPPPVSASRGDFTNYEMERKAQGKTMRKIAGSSKTPAKTKCWLLGFFFGSIDFEELYRVHGFARSGASSLNKEATGGDA